jgi:hypothetical protein
LDPPLELVPDGDWFCDACIKHMAKIAKVINLNKIIKIGKNLV